MGLSFSLWSSVNPVKKYRIVMVGLDGAGKTTILSKLKRNEVPKEGTVPTIGFNVETVQVTDNIHMTLFDVGGQDIIRPMWEHYYEGAHAVIFVIDSNDKERLKEAKQELDWVVAEEKLSKAVILILANKQDLPHAVTVVEVADTMDLREDLKGHKWFIQGCCATTGDGLWAGIHWLAAHLD